MLCKLCGSPSTPFARAVVLGKHTVQYYACDDCGFIQTQDPYWLAEAYSDAIARSDVGLVGRNIKMAQITASVITLLFSRRARYLDYGGGNGMFVRLMRDKGFDFYWCDKYAVNQFAVGFEASLPGRYELLTAYEVFEHLADPISEIGQMLSYSDSILFSTLLVPPSRPLPHEWWYYTLDTGQHISLYSGESLSKLARRLHLHFYSNTRSVHLLTRRSIIAPLFTLLALPPVAALLSPVLTLGRKSLLDNDYFRLTGKHSK